MDIKELEKVWGLKHYAQGMNKCNDEPDEHYRLPSDKNGNWIHIRLYPSKFEKYGSIDSIELLDDWTDEKTSMSAYREGTDLPISWAHSIKLRFGADFWALLHILGYVIPEGTKRDEELTLVPRVEE